MAFIFGGGIGNSGGGLFGGGGGYSFPTITGISSSLLAASYSAKITNNTLGSLSATDRAAFDLSGVTDQVETPWDKNAAAEHENEGPLSLDKRVRAVRDKSQFINLKDDDLEAVEGDPDRHATFAIYKALTDLKTLAEFAADDKTISSSLGRLDEKFQQGMTEIRDYLADSETEKLDLFLGEKEYKTESATRTGKNNTEMGLSGIVETADDIVTDLTGTEVFTISVTKSGEIDEISVDLSTMTEDLTLNNIKDHINSAIEAVLLVDEFDEPILDSEGETQSKHLTRMNVELQSNGKYGLKIEGTLTEQVSFSAETHEKALYVTGNVTQLDDSYAVTSRLVEFASIATSLTQDNVTSFAATDLEASEIKELTKDEDEEELDPELQKLRDKIRADALADITNDDSTDDDDEEEVDEEASSITNINSEIRVNADTISQGVVVDSAGNSYVVGHSKGSFGHQINVAAENDVFLSKFDTEGNLQYSRLLGISGSAEAYGITLDSQDNVIITGQTDSAVIVQTSKNTNAGIINGDIIKDSQDTFVAKYSAEGTEVFRYQLDTTKETKGLSVIVDSSDDIYVAGYSSSSFSGSTSFGGGTTDAMILKLSGDDGSVESSTLIGDSTSEKVSQIAIASDGNIVVAIEDSGVARLKKLDAADLTTEMFNIEIGAIGTKGEITGIAIDGDQIALSGFSQYSSIDSSGTATVNGTNSGFDDGFVAAFTDGGSSVTADFVTFIGTTAADSANGIAIDNGKIYVAGSTGGDLEGEDRTGISDAFVSRLDATTGLVEDTQLFGEGVASIDVTGIGFTDKGNSVLGTLGIPQGAVKYDQQLDLETQTSARAGDHFYISIDNGTKKKIEINEGDDYDDLARKLRIAGFGKFTVEVSSGTEGDKLKIQALDPKNSPTIDLLAGADGKDALSRLGLDAGRLLSKNDVFNISEDDEEVEKDGPEDTGGAFGLDLEGALHIKDKTTAKYVLGLLETAIGTIERAERSLTYNPLKALIRSGALNQAPPPPRIAAQISSYQDALQRLQAGSQSGPTSLFT